MTYIFYDGPAMSKLNINCISRLTYLPTICSHEAPPVCILLAREGVITLAKLVKLGPYSLGLGATQKLKDVFFVYSVILTLNEGAASWEI
jgi:hypothetical protein